MFVDIPHYLPISPNLYPMVCDRVWEKEKRRSCVFIWTSQFILSNATYRSHRAAEATKLNTGQSQRAREESVHSFSLQCDQDPSSSVSVHGAAASSGRQHSRSRRRTETIIIISRQLHQVESLKNMLFNLGSMYESSVVIRRCVDEHLSSGSGIR